MADPYRTGREGLILVATPKLDGTHWARNCVYIFEDNQLGTQGLVTNNPSRVPLAEAFSNPYLDELSNTNIYIGGPVNPRGAYLLHSSEWASSNTIQVNDSYSVTSDKIMMDKMISMGEPVYWKMCVGCASWAPGQLDAEIEQGMWLTAPAVDSIVFECNTLTQWNRAIEHTSAHLFDQYI